MIIVSGHMRVKSGKRATFLKASHAAMEAARKAASCRHFIVAADPIEEDRVNVF